METHFQTSFIPKKPIVSSGSQISPSTSQGASLLMIIGIFIFIISLLVAGGAYGYKAWLLSQRKAYEITLKERNDQFDIGQITKLKQTDSKIVLAKQILKEHVATTLVLEKLSKLTSEGIRFTSFDMTAAGANAQGINKGINLSLSGYGQTYKVVAFQSDLFDDLEAQGLRGVITGGVVTNPVQSQNGTVSFDMTASINPDSVSYARTITGLSVTASSSTSSSTQP